MFSTNRPKVLKPGTASAWVRS